MAYFKKMAENREVFKDTMIKSNKFNMPCAVKYKGALKNYVVKPKFTETKFSVVNSDCIDACITINLKDPSSKIALQNNASEYKPGGGVTKGSIAQEECICRETTLYKTIKDCSYPLDTDEMLYSDEVYILKDGNYNDISPNPRIAVITAAALRKPQLTEGKYKNADKKIMEQKIHMLLQTLYYHECETLVLGAWGCGVFGNPIDEVAEIYHHYLTGEFKNAFKNVTFAILEKNGNPIGSVFKNKFEC